MLTEFLLMKKCLKPELDKLWNLKLNDELYKSLEEYIENLNVIEYKSKDIK